MAPSAVARLAPPEPSSSIFSSRYFETTVFAAALVARHRLRRNAHDRLSVPLFPGPVPIVLLESVLLGLVSWSSKCTWLRVCIHSDSRGRRLPPKFQNIACTGQVYRDINQSLVSRSLDLGLALNLARILMRRCSTADSVSDHTTKRNAESGSA